MKLLPFSIEHFDQIEWQGAQSAGKLHYSEEVAWDVARESEACSAIDADGYVLACAGVYPTRIVRQVNGPDQIETSLAWAIFSPRFLRKPKGVIRAIREFLKDRNERRIEAYVDPAHANAAPFLNRLGFEFERELDVSEHPDGRVLHLYARVRA